MSERRKQRRRNARGKGSTKQKASSQQASRQPLRRTAAERFRRDGSEKLWSALLGWVGERRLRIWLVEAVWDEGLTAHRGQPASAARVIEAFAKRRPDLAERLDSVRLEAAIAAVQAHLSGGESAFPHLVSVVAEASLGSVSATQLEEDFVRWDSLDEAAIPHQQALATLMQAEQAVVQLNSIAQSERLGHAASLIQSLWRAMAYGDEDMFEALRHVAISWSNEAPADGRNS